MLKGGKGGSKLLHFVHLFTLILGKSRFCNFELICMDSKPLFSCHLRQNVEKFHISDDFDNLTNISNETAEAEDDPKDEADVEEVGDA